MYTRTHSMNALHKNTEYTSAMALGSAVSQIMNYIKYMKKSCQTYADDEGF